MDGRRSWLGKEQTNGVLTGAPTRYSTARRDEKKRRRHKKGRETAHVQVGLHRDPMVEAGGRRKMRANPRSYREDGLGCERGKERTLKTLCL